MNNTMFLAPSGSRASQSLVYNPTAKGIPEQAWRLNTDNDCTRFCYIYLLRSKDEALHYFKIYKAEVENQLERKKSKELGQIVVAISSQIYSLYSARNMVLFMRGRLHIHLSQMGLPKERTAL